MKKASKNRHIFISHSWDDKPFVRRLEDMLREADVDVWVDHEEVRGGDSIPKRINEALDRCDTVLLVWSATASDSIWVEREWSAALHLNKIIIPCLLDDTEVPHLLTSYASIDFQDFDSGWTALKRTVSTHPVAEKPPTPAAPTPKAPARRSYSTLIIAIIGLLGSVLIVFSMTKREPAIIIDETDSVESALDDTAAVYFSIVNPMRNDISVTSIRAYVTSVCDSCDLPIRAVDRYDLGNHAISMNPQSISDPREVHPVGSQQTETFYFDLFTSSLMRRDYKECLAGYSAILEVQYNDPRTSEKKVVESKEFQIGPTEQSCQLP